MSPATWPRQDPLSERLLHLGRVDGALRDGAVGDLLGHLAPGDLVVVNDAATLPASLPAAFAGDELELRLVGARADGCFDVVTFGAGDHRTPTEHRAAPPELSAGDAIEVGDGALTALVVEVSPVSPRLVRVRFDCERDLLWATLYDTGRPIQYSHVPDPLPLFHVQTAFAARPWAVELPSAGRPLRMSLLFGLRDRGVALGRVTHAAGLSSTGDPVLDAMLPFPERYDVPAETVEAVRRARARGGRVVAVGTSVVRALEAAAESGELVAGEGVTDLKIGPTHPLRVVDAVLTGMHEPGTSHYALLGAFVEESLLHAAYEHAVAAGYLAHEFGDSMLIL